MDSQKQIQDGISGTFIDGIMMEHEGGSIEDNFVHALMSGVEQEISTERARRDKRKKASKAHVASRKRNRGR